MKLNILTSILFFGLTFSYAQVETNRLPKGGQEYKDNRSNFIFEIVVDHNNIYFNDSLIKVNDLGELARLKRIKSTNTSFHFPKVFLYADRNINYKIIDSIKAELAKAFVHRIIYKTINKKQDTLEYAVIKKLHLALNYDKEQLKYEKINDSINYSNFEEEEIIIENILITETPSERSLYQNLYNLKFAIAKKQLERINYKKIEFVNKRFLLIDGKKIKLENYKNIGQEIIDSDLCFIVLNNKLKYHNYIKSLDAIQKARIYFRKEKIYIPRLEEISIQLKEKIKNAYLKF